MFVASAEDTELRFLVGRPFNRFRGIMLAEVPISWYFLIRGDSTDLR